MKLVLWTEVTTRPSLLSGILTNSTKTRTYVDKTGDRRYVTEVIAKSFIILNKVERSLL